MGPQNGLAQLGLGSGRGFIVRIVNMIEERGWQGGEVVRHN
jgi:hypothetical protein